MVDNSQIVDDECLSAIECVDLCLPAWRMSARAGGVNTP